MCHNDTPKQLWFDLGNTDLMPPPLAIAPGKSRHFSGKAAPSADKLRGGYYTPKRIAEWLCKWAIRSKSNSVLEPSCGNGTIAVEAAQRLLNLGAKPSFAAEQLVALELISAEGTAAAANISSALGVPTQVGITDFFLWESNTTSSFDCVVGNPPFVRFQTITEPIRTRSMDLLRRIGLKPNRLTNLWVPFVVGAVERLKPGGRMALVVPAELLQVSYAAQLRTYLVDSFSRIEMVGCNELFFDGAEQEVVLLLAEGKRGIRNAENICLVDLMSFDRVGEMLACPPLHLVDRREFKSVRHESEKWLKYFLSPREIGLLRALRESSDFTTLKTFAEINVGIVTGNNDFFVLSRSEVTSQGVGDDVTPIVGRSSQLRGAVFTPADYKRAVADDERAMLFSSNESLSKLSAYSKRYVLEGQRKGVPKGYKCSIREPWYEVPSVWTPDAFMFRQISDFPKLSLNWTRASSTDTIHRVKLSADPDRFLINFYTYLTAASAEVEGRSYGGGVLELEPTEAERLLFPAKLQRGLSVAQIDESLRKRKLDNILEENSRKVLIDGIGISKRDCDALRGIWDTMRQRRSNRRKSPKS